MATINLLPWREERRQELKKEFLVVLGAVAGIAVLIVLVIHMLLQSAIDAQQGRNAYLNKNIKELEVQVREIRDLKKKKQEMLDRMTVIQQLQGNRPLIVRVFDEIVRTLPDGIFYDSLKRNNNVIVVTGIAESNNRISSLMRKLEASEWFESPNLTKVTAAPSYGDQASAFTLSFKISAPAKSDSEERK